MAAQSHVDLRLGQHDFDVGPNMALMLANVDPNMVFILTDLRLGPTRL